MKRRKSWLTIAPAVAAISLTVICLAIIVLGVFGYIRLDDRISTHISSAHQNQASQPLSSDLQTTIDFLKDQMQTLIWLLGVIIAGAGAVLAFLGVTTRKSVEEKYEQKYSELIAAKDTEVFKKKIVLLYQDNDDTLIGFRDEIRDRGHNTKLIKASSQDITLKLQGASMVIYHVNNRSDTQYQAIADWCESKRTHCILYCPGVRLSDEFMHRNLSYVSTSIQLAKLRESFYTLLYLAP